MLRTEVVGEDKTLEMADGGMCDGAAAGLPRG
jgi:hypothetical protein